MAKRVSGAISEMKYHQGGSPFDYDKIKIARIVINYASFIKTHNAHLKFLAAIQGVKI